MLKNDKWIIEQATKGMIEPFEKKSIRKITGDISQDIPAISWGLSSYGYDVRLSPHDFRIFRHIPGTVVDPKNFNPKNLEQASLHTDKDGSYFIIPANSYGLGASLESIKMPPNVTAICLGKSTYARVGVIANITPLEASWHGKSITLEFSNASSADVKIYANEGVVQLLFFEGEACETTYQKRSGKYQNQGSGVTLPKV
ncbi:MAG: dCTP deaminase [Xenococcaceae cyanobacterium MO_188.B19]|nr:dCTP deaminase [Xenococcaceae cyanobacterium MO_188.B19]